MIQLGRYPAPLHTIAHLSDPHLTSGDRPLNGSIDTRRSLERSLEQLEASGAAPEAIVFTGDLTDLGEPDAYRSLREIVDPVAERMGSRIIWVMGNHDERAEYQSGLLDEPGSSAPQDRVYDLGGLRVIALDTTVPGYHHGDLTADQLDWLADELATPAPQGTILAMHHPPIPTPLELMVILELRHQDELAEVIRGTDVRGVLAGHLHYSAHSTFAGVPVSVSSASCYLIDVSSPPRTQLGRDGGRAFDLVHVYEDRIVHSTVPVGDNPVVSGFRPAFVAALASMTPERQLEVFSDKRSTVTVAEVEASGAARTAPDHSD